MFIELNLVTDQKKRNTRKILLNTDHIVSVEREYGDPMTGSIIRVTDPVNVNSGVIVEESYDTIMATLSMGGKYAVVEKGEVV